MLVEMDMRRRAVNPRGQRAVEGHENLALAVPHPAQPQNLSRVPVLQLKKRTHESSPVFEVAT
jgi:hypothetical protein